ncbi:MAG: hypothetical protein ACJ78R_12345 [Gemmatimonadaceae bacterium]
MRRAYTSLLPAAFALLACNSKAQVETSRQVSDGGVSVSGWTGMVDPNEAKRGAVLTSAKLTKEGNDLHVTTGPALAYWNPANTASGDYTVKATFTEAKYMNLNDHPHPYGIFIGGSDMGTANQSYLYCAAYGNGNFIVRGFGPAPFQLNGGRGEANAAVHKASGPGAAVTQDIAVSVKGDNVQCAINGQVVATYKKSDVVGAGKLKSTDGVYGIRFAHNTEGSVSGLTVTKP